MSQHAVVSKEEWLVERTKLLIKEKEFTRLRDELSATRRDLPWVKLDRDYTFTGSDGSLDLSGLFADKSQLMIYHFMLGPEWEEGCPSCSFWADNFNGIDIHLAHRDISFMAISRAPIKKINDYKKRMGWSFNWVSSFNSDFNYDFGVSFTEQDKQKNDTFYNYRNQPYFVDELPGVSVFYKNEAGEIFHTYSSYARGLDILNGAYNYIDLSPKGRNEDSPMSWLHRHDQYDIKE